MASFVHDGGERDFTTINPLRASRKDCRSRGIEHPRQGQRGHPRLFSRTKNWPNDTSSTVRRLYLPFVRRVQHFDDRPPDEAGSLGVDPEATRFFPSGKRMLGADWNLLVLKSERLNSTAAAKGVLL